MNIFTVLRASITIRRGPMSPQAYGRRALMYNIVITPYLLSISQNCVARMFVEMFPVLHLCELRTTCEILCSDGGEYEDSLHALILEAVRSPETPVYFNETTQRCVPEGCHLRTPSQHVTHPHQSSAHQCLASARCTFQAYSHVSSVL
jgi:hypothetical protein